MPKSQAVAGLGQNEWDPGKPVLALPSWRAAPSSLTLVMPDFISPAFPEAQEGASTQAEPPPGLPGVLPSTAPLGGNKAEYPTPYFPEDPGVQGRFREQEALIGACCITRGKVLGAVEEREEEQREEVMAPPSQQQNPLQAGKSLSPGILISLYRERKSHPADLVAGPCCYSEDQDLFSGPTQAGPARGEGWSLMWGHRGRSSKSS